MAAKGMMDGWHGDEYECHGNCGQCDRCERALERNADDAIDNYFVDDY